MKRKIIVALALVLALMVTAAGAAFAQTVNDNDTPLTAAQKNLEKRNDNAALADNPNSRATERAQQRLAWLTEVKPLIREINQNRVEIRRLEAELRRAHQAVRAHIAALREDPGAITDEQIAQLQALLQQLKTQREALRDTNPSMVRERQALRDARRSGDLDAITAAYRQIIAVQRQRMEMLRALIEINNNLTSV